MFLEFDLDSIRFAVAPTTRALFDFYLYNASTKMRILGPTIVKNIFRFTYSLVRTCIKKCANKTAYLNNITRSYVRIGKLILTLAKMILHVRKTII